jgi:hypothetical protein
VKDTAPVSAGFPERLFSSLVFSAPTGGFQLIGVIEMVLDHMLAAAGHEDELLDARLRASSTPYWITGLSTTGSISFGTALVAGRKRVPMPATGKTALRIRGVDMHGREQVS